MDVKKHFCQAIDQTFWFAITATQKGIFAGAEKLLIAAMEMPLKNIWVAAEGAELSEGNIVFQAFGDAVTVALAEERLLGLIGKPSGVATASRNMVDAARGRIKVVCGAWKKVFPENKDELRKSILVGGAGIRITDAPFMYVDKNFVRMAGGIGNAVVRAATLPDRTVAVQLKGEYDAIADEAIEAVEAGAGIVMVDTGKVDDIKQVVKCLIDKGYRDAVKIGFGGAVTVSELEAVIKAGADVVDVGRAIIDAPIIDFRFDVITNAHPHLREPGVDRFVGSSTHESCSPE